MKKVICFLLCIYGLAACGPNPAEVQEAIQKSQTTEPVRAITNTSQPIPIFSSTPLATTTQTAAVSAEPTTSENTALPTSLPSTASPDPSVLLTYIDGDGGDVFTSEDNMLLSNPPDINLATHDVYDVSTSRKFIQRFNLSAIPAGSILQSAKIYYYKTSAVPNQNVTLTIFSISKANGDWPEGTKYNRPAQPGDSSWNFKDAAGIAWAGSPGLSTSGVDYEPTPLCSFVIPARAQVGDEFVCDLDTTRVAGWFGTPNTNYGILMVANDKAEYIGSAENPNPGFRPKLVVEYFLKGAD